MPLSPLGSRAVLDEFELNADNSLAVLEFPYGTGAISEATLDIGECWTALAGNAHQADALEVELFQESSACISVIAELVAVSVEHGFGIADTNRGAVGARLCQFLSEPWLVRFDCTDLQPRDEVCLAKGHDECANGIPAWFERDAIAITCV